MSGWGERSFTRRYLGKYPGRRAVLPFFFALLRFSLPFRLWFVRFFYGRLFFCFRLAVMGVFCSIHIVVLFAVIVVIIEFDYPVLPTEEFSRA